MVKPIKTFSLLIYITLILGVMLLLPDEITLIGDQSIKIPKLSTLFQSTKNNYADITEIREQFEQPEASVAPSEKVPQDSLEKKKKIKPYIPDSLRIDPERRIQYPKNEDTLLYDFFRALRQITERNTSVRVLHFGDSQLEGDRITGFLREKFQKEFGGCGVGICNILDKLNSKTSIAQSTPSNWQRQVVYGPQYRRGATEYYGLLGDLYRFSVPEEPAWTTASLIYQKSPYATPIQQEVKEIKVLYRNPEAPFELKIQAPGEPEIKEKIEVSPKFSIFRQTLTSPFERVEIGFATGSQSPEIYGVALDCKKGITFDNIPWRGSSGIEFTRINQAHLKRQLELLNANFLILQFGVNIVPNPQPNYGWYENLFYQQLKFLKSLKPNLSILVVGVSDMSLNIDGTYQSYPNIEKIRDAQRSAAFRADCAFWDLYEAMGGKNSMPSWVFAQPVPLANKDFTHFTSKGASIVSEMLYNALLTEYDKFNALLN